METAPATGIPASTPPAPRKASSKRKHCAPPATSSAVASAPAKRARSQSQGAIPQQTEDPILAALSNIQTSLLDMDARILNLENSPSATSFVFNEPAIGASSAATYNANPAPSNLAIEPRRNMGTAAPTAPVGVPFFPAAAAISPHLRAQILADSGCRSDLRFWSLLCENWNSISFFYMTRYLRRRPLTSPDEPLFITDKGNAMTRSWFSACLCLVCQYCGLSPELYTAHSFRIGAATTAATVAPTCTIKAMGRWSSAAYERYIRPDIDEIISIQKIMSLET
ncbi:hypothetical protein SKAU_G00285370 [Synaphobranchus kaupii]|uniref:Tyr recombinase domain-containing protein n=1 Tax=Synaphobranchus kaupii TaxID=118154 RepID=A0A9Q1EXX5_SYNKA|nr:hypothetical protein SKAU_G00285370 [Synaphobranchus kaupii]